MADTILSSPTKAPKPEPKPEPPLPISQLLSEELPPPADWYIDEYIQKKSGPARAKTLALKNLNKGLKWLERKHTKHLETVMIHIHGGGFVAMSSSSHQNYLIPWANQLKIPIFSIDYRLAPEAQYPCILNDAINGYLWVLYFVEEVLGVKIKNLILTGDSAGGNFVLTITNWCIVNGIRKPDYIFPHYPGNFSRVKKYSSLQYGF